MRRILTATLIALTITAATITPAASTPAPKPPTQHEVNVWLWYAEINRQADYARLLAFAASIEAARIAASHHGYGWVQGIKVCDGPGLVPCVIVHRESRFDPRARNPRSTAGGLYQFLRAWLRECGLSGYRNMADVPVSQQVDCSRHAVATQGLRPWRS